MTLFWARYKIRVTYIFILSVYLIYFYRFKEGLQTLNFANLMRSQPGVFQDLFCEETSPLTSDCVTAIFLNTEYSERKELMMRQEEAYAWFLDFMQDLEDGVHLTYLFYLFI